MKKLTRTVTLLSITALLTVVLSCGGQGNKGKSGAAQAPKTVDYSQHETFTAWLQGEPTEFYNDYSENPIVWYLNKKFNITLKFEQPVRGSESDALSLMFGTGEYTDMIWIIQYTGSKNDLYKDGVLVDIAEYLDYMPNFKKRLESDDGYRRACYNDDGKILELKPAGAPGGYESFAWGGLVYRRDILEKPTAGAIRFPSGNDYPKTIDDWEYMLPLFKSYFESLGAEDYAPFILPYYGYFGFGDLMNGFGVENGYYIEDSKVKNGFYEEAFFKYLKKMGEWYAKGWIYKDFASRTNDPFYLPNTALTYGGNAGVWFGLSGQLGDAMSMPQYGMFFDVRPIPSPLSTADGIAEFTNLIIGEAYENPGYSFTTKCENLPKLLNVLDYLYSEEGGRLISGGLTKETGAAENPVYQAAGFQDGLYWYEGDTVTANPALAGHDRNEFLGLRLPGLIYTGLQYGGAIEREKASTQIWSPYTDAKIKKVPGAISYTAEEEKVFSTNGVKITDYLNSMIPKFIMGTAPLNDQSWTDYKAQLKTLGIEENLRLTQTAYERYLKR